MVQAQNARVGPRRDPDAVVGHRDLSGACAGDGLVAVIIDSDHVVELGYIECLGDFAGGFVAHFNGVEGHLLPAPQGVEHHIAFGLKFDDAVAVGIGRLAVGAEFGDPVPGLGGAIDAEFVEPAELFAAMGGPKNLWILIVYAHAAKGAGTLKAKVEFPALPSVGVGQIVRAQGAADHVAGRVAPVGHFALVFLDPDFGRILRGVNIGGGEPRGARPRTGQDRPVEVVDRDHVEFVVAGSRGIALPVVAVPGDSAIAGFGDLTRGGGDVHILGL